MTHKFRGISAILRAHEYFSENHKAPYIALRIALAVSSIFAMHVFGYVHKLGVGVAPFIGLEVTADLLANVFYNSLNAFVVFILSAFAFYILFRIIYKLFGSVDEPAFGSEFGYWLALAAAMGIFVNDYVSIESWSASFGYANSTFLFSISALAFVLSVFLFWLKIIGTQMFSAVVISFLLSFSYLLGEVKAGSTPEYAWKQIVFVDDSRLDGFPLHRVRDGFIFRKRSYFAFDSGAVFVPFHSVKFITEPSRTSGGEQVFSRDYPSWIVTAP
ncbi:hypothetical protein [uncultured Roseobacter sp.]|uniref:hypothetical protein n=1 Tax=uncultured Roseobacter sp. TaxID=114847 RepID=UPI00260A26CC|nr:hypothetical protein [uncultured Roseobacter sp.]